MLNYADGIDLVLKGRLLLLPADGLSCLSPVFAAVPSGLFKKPKTAALALFCGVNL